MTEPSQPDKSEIPSAKLNDPRLKQAKQRLCDHVRDRKLRRSTCVHEAAHFVYGERAGVIDFEFRRPTIRYDQTSDKFDSTIASVRPIFPDKKPEQCSEQAIARMLVAGCIAECLLTESGDMRSDSMDFEVFRKRFIEFRSNEELLGSWEAAKRDVRKDLRSPALRKELWTCGGQTGERVFRMKSHKLK
jgi:hypothetical protein